MLDAVFNAGHAAASVVAFTSEPALLTQPVVRLAGELTEVTFFELRLVPLDAESTSPVEFGDFMNRSFVA